MGYFYLAKVLAVSLLAVSVNSVADTSCLSAKHGYICELGKTQYWGVWSIMHSAGSKASRKLPRGCEQNQITYLGRHAIRGRGEEIDDKARQSVKEKISELPEEEDQKKRMALAQLSELCNKDLPKDPNTEVTEAGKRQLELAGQRVFTDYLHLTSEHKPFMRSSPVSRCQDGATDFMRGFDDARFGHKKEKTGWTKADLEITPMLCSPWKGDYPAKIKTQKEKYQKEESARADEILTETFGGIETLITEIDKLKYACISGTFYHPEGKVSDWCQPFTATYWQNSDYQVSTSLWYKFGPGSETKPKESFMWIVDLLERLTSGSTNHDQLRAEDIIQRAKNAVISLSDGDDVEWTSPRTEKVLVDISHIEDIYPILTYLGVFDLSKPPQFFDPFKIQTLEEAGQSAAWAAPLGGRSIIERIQCKGRDEQFVRIVHNDAVRELYQLSTENSPGIGIYPIDEFMRGLDANMARYVKEETSSSSA